jgi:hypothetical protein
MHKSRPAVGATSFGLEIGVLFANSNLFSVTLCISAFIALALSILITFSPSLRCTRFVTADVAEWLD